MLIVAVISWLCGAPSPGLVRLLSAYDETAITVAGVQANTDNPTVDLLALAHDTKQPMLVRGRAVLFIAEFAGPQMRPALIVLADDKDPPLRIKALLAMRRLFRHSDQSGLTDVALQQSVERHLDDSDARVRVHAANVLGLVPDKHAVLAAHLRVEKDARVRDALAEALQH